MPTGTFVQIKPGDILTEAGFNKVRYPGLTWDEFRKHPKKYQEVIDNAYRCGLIKHPCSH